MTGTQALLDALTAHSRKRREAVRASIEKALKDNAPRARDHHQQRVAPRQSDPQGDPLTGVASGACQPPLTLVSVPAMAAEPRAGRRLDAGPLPVRSGAGRLSSWPEVADEDAVTYFTLSADDLSWLAGFNRQHKRLGVAVQLSTLPWLGWIPDDLAGCPPIALDRLAQALVIAPDTSSALLAEYGGWQGRTRREHQARVLTRLGWRLYAAGKRKLLDEFLVARALEHDAPSVLLQLACDWLRAERNVRPPVDSLTRRVATVRDAARAETYHRLGPLLQPPRPMQLDGLLDVDPDLGMTRLAWLRRGATPELLKAELDKLEFLRRHGADRLDFSRLPVGRRRMLAEIGRRSTNQALQRAAVDRRHPVLLATLAETCVEVLDELVQLLDQPLARADSRARHEISQQLIDRAKAEVDRGRLLDEILDVLADATVPDEQAGRVVRQRVGMQRLIAARRPAEDRGQRDHGHFDLLAARYKYLRTFTPVVIAALPLTGNTASPSVTALPAAVEVLRELNAAARTAVLDEATTAAATVFVPARWRGYLDAARGQGRGATYRHYWGVRRAHAASAPRARITGMLMGQAIATMDGPYSRSIMM
jgi:hypothetical protein